MSSSVATIPRLPLPELKETLLRYIRIVTPLITPEQLERTKKLVDEFLAGDGPRLQEAVEMYNDSEQAKNSSYIQVWWDDMYLKQRESIMINTSPFFSFQDDPKPENNEQVRRAASFLASLMKFAQEIWTGTLKPDEDRGKPMCMAQHQNLLGTTRIPGLKKDVLKNYQSRNVVVNYRNHMFWFPVFSASGEPLAEKDIEANIQEIVDTVRASSKAGLPVSVFTADNRTQWSIVRALMQRSEANAKSLEIIESALTVVVLEDTTPVSFNEESPIFLHGDGCNRWMDKSLQLVVCANGRIGMPMEHSGYDGHTFLRMANEVFATSTTHSAQTGVESFLPRTKPQAIEWDLTERLMQQMAASVERVKAQIAGLETVAQEFEDFGKLRIVQAKFSPDAVVQMAFQLAYYRHRNRFDCTYESVLTKFYQHGRTEALRSVTSESCHFAKTFCDDSASPLQRRQALEAAVAAHGMLLNECKQGRGIDRHLLAIKNTGTLLLERPLDLFTDPTYCEVLKKDVLSTSNCASNAIRLFGFGPVVSNGYGIAYTIRDNNVGFNVTSKFLQTRAFMDQIVQALRDIKEVFDVRTS